MSPVRDRSRGVDNVVLNVIDNKRLRSTPKPSNCVAAWPLWPGGPWESLPQSLLHQCSSQPLPKWRALLESVPSSRGENRGYRNIDYVNRCGLSCHTTDGSSFRTSEKRMWPSEQPWLRTTRGLLARDLPSVRIDFRAQSNMSAMDQETLSGMM